MEWLKEFKEEEDGNSEKLLHEAFEGGPAGPIRKPLPPHPQALWDNPTCPNGQSDVDLIKEGEGFRSCMYYDTMAVPTICYGQNLNNDYAKPAIESVGGSYEDVMAGGCLSET